MIVPESKFVYLNRYMLRKIINFGKNKKIFLQNTQNREKIKN